MVSDESAHSPTQLNLSFAGCGFLGIYHVGVASCIQKYAPHLISNHITGASAGSLVAAGMLCNLPIGEAATFTLNLARKARDRALGPLHPQFNITNHLRSGLEVFLPENAHTICTGRLFVSLTRVRDRKNVLMSQFDSKDDLIQCLLCSAHVPFWSGIMPPLYRGERYIDGGLSLNNPILNENTITVSPFSGESDICPDDKSASFMHVCLAGTSIQMNCGNLFRISHAFFPPVPEILSNMCKQGFDDALNYLQKSDLISCTKHLSVLSSIHSGSSFSLEQLVKEEKKLLEGTAEDETSSYDGDEEKSSLYSDTSEEDKRHYCDDCRQKKESLSVTSLPPPVVQALQAACDSVNKGVLATIYKMRVFKVLSLMTAPWILPFDVGIVMAQKFYDWVPYMPSDMQWFAKELVELLKVLYKAVQARRHHYSARFACQLAITDLNITKMEEQVEAAITTPVVTPQPPRKVFGPARRRDIGMGVSADFHPTHHLSPLACADDLRRYLEIDHLCGQKTGVTEDVDYVGSPHVVHRENKQTAWVPQDALHAHYDSFENCLHIANQMDSILTFYYMEEDDPTSIKVTEIFPIGDRLQSPIHTHKSQSHEQAERVFEDFMEKHPAAEETPARKRPGLRRCMSEVMTDEYLKSNNEGMAKPRCGLPAITEELASVDSLSHLS